MIWVNWILSIIPYVPPIVPLLVQVVLEKEEPSVLGHADPQAHFLRRTCSTFGCGGYALRRFDREPLKGLAVDSAGMETDEVGVDFVREA